MSVQQGKIAAKHVFYLVERESSLILLDSCVIRHLFYPNDGSFLKV